MPPLHPLIVHFPIALFVVAVLFDAVTMFTKKRTLDVATRWLMVLSWLGAGVAILTGEWLKDSGRVFPPHALLDTHQTLAILFGVWVTLLTVLRLRKRWRPSGGYMTLAALGFILLVLVGHTGGEMAWPTLPAVAIKPAATGLAAQTSSPSGSSPGLAGGTTSSASQSKKSSTATASTSKPAAVHQSTKPASSSQTSTHSTVSATASGGQTSTSSTSKSSGSTQSSGASAGSSAPSSARQSNAASSGGTATPSGPTYNVALYNEGDQFFVNDCQTCHSLDVAQQYFGQLSQAQWEQVLADMQNRAGGSISNTDVSDILYYFDNQK